jgi:Biopolymer transport protein ExbD/TolR
MITISIDKSGGVFFGMDGQETRSQALEQMADKYNIKFTKKQVYEFSKLSAFGVPMNELPGFLELSNFERGQYKKKGIPIDSADNQLKEWIDISRRLKRYRIAIKGDQKAIYKSSKKVIGALQDLNINRFNLVTTIEAKPKGLNTH